MKNDLKLNMGDLQAKLGSFGRKIGAYKVFLFFLVVAALYGFIVWRINAFNNTAPSTSEQTAKTVSQPRIDPATVAKLQSLQDNSVNVQTLFDSARQNPFQE